MDEITIKLFRMATKQTGIPANELPEYMGDLLRRAYFMGRSNYQFAVYHLTADLPPQENRFRQEHELPY